MFTFSPVGIKMNNKLAGAFSTAQDRNKRRSEASQLNRVTDPKTFTLDTYTSGMCACDSAAGFL